MFQDEKLLEVKGRVLELLDLTLEEDDLDISFEKPASKDLTILSHTIFVTKDEKQKRIINLWNSVHLLADYNHDFASSSTVYELLL